VMAGMSAADRWDTALTAVTSPMGLPVLIEGETMTCPSVQGHDMSHIDGRTVLQCVAVLFQAYSDVETPTMAIRTVGESLRKRVIISGRVAGYEALAGEVLRWAKGRIRTISVMASSLPVTSSRKAQPVSVATLHQHARMYHTHHTRDMHDTYAKVTASALQRADADFLERALSNGKFVAPRGLGFDDLVEGICEVSQYAQEYGDGIAQAYGTHISQAIISMVIGALGAETSRFITGSVPFLSNMSSSLAKTVPAGVLGLLAVEKSVFRFGHDYARYQFMLRVLQSLGSHLSQTGFDASPFTDPGSRPSSLVSLWQALPMSADQLDSALLDQVCVTRAVSLALCVFAASVQTLTGRFAGAIDPLTSPEIAPEAQLTVLRSLEREVPGMQETHARLRDIESLLEEFGVHTAEVVDPDAKELHTLLTDYREFLAKRQGELNADMAGRSPDAVLADYLSVARALDDVMQQALDDYIDIQTRARKGARPDQAEKGSRDGPGKGRYSVGEQDSEDEYSSEGSASDFAVDEPVSSAAVSSVMSPTLVSGEPSGLFADGFSLEELKSLQLRDPQRLDEAITLDEWQLARSMALVQVHNATKRDRLSAVASLEAMETVLRKRSIYVSISSESLATRYALLDNLVTELAQSLQGKAGSVQECADQVSEATSALEAFASVLQDARDRVVNASHTPQSAEELQTGLSDLLDVREDLLANVADMQRVVDSLSSLVALPLSTTTLELLRRALSKVKGRWDRLFEYADSASLKRDAVMAGVAQVAEWVEFVEGTLPGLEDWVNQTRKEVPLVKGTNAPVHLHNIDTELSRRYSTVYRLGAVSRIITESLERTEADPELRNGISLLNGDGGIVIDEIRPTVAEFERSWQALRTELADSMGSRVDTHPRGGRGGTDGAVSVSGVDGLEDGRYLRRLLELMCSNSHSTITETAGLLHALVTGETDDSSDTTLQSLALREFPAVFHILRLIQSIRIGTGLDSHSPDIDRVGLVAKQELDYRGEKEIQTISEASSTARQELLAQVPLLTDMLRPESPAIGRLESLVAREAPLDPSAQDVSDALSPDAIASRYEGLRSALSQTVGNLVTETRAFMDQRRQKTCAQELFSRLQCMCVELADSLCVPVPPMRTADDVAAEKDRAETLTEQYESVCALRDELLQYKTPTEKDAGDDEEFGESSSQGSDEYEVMGQFVDNCLQVLEGLRDFHAHTLSTGETVTHEKARLAERQFELFSLVKDVLQIGESVVSQAGLVESSSDVSSTVSDASHMASLIPLLSGILTDLRQLHSPTIQGSRLVGSVRVPALTHVVGSTTVPGAKGGDSSIGLAEQLMVIEPSKAVPVDELDALAERVTRLSRAIPPALESLSSRRSLATGELRLLARCDDSQHLIESANRLLDDPLMSVPEVLDVQRGVDIGSLFGPPTAVPDSSGVPHGGGVRDSLLDRHPLEPELSAISRSQALGILTDLKSSRELCMYLPGVEAVLRYQSDHLTNWHQTLRASVGSVIRAIEEHLEIRRRSRISGEDYGSSTDSVTKETETEQTLILKLTQLKDTRSSAAERVNMSRQDCAVSLKGLRGAAAAANDYDTEAAELKRLLDDMATSVQTEVPLTTPSVTCHTEFSPPPTMYTPTPTVYIKYKNSLVLINAAQALTRPE
ncbi:hypothetical protein KIPB_002596, partial [Kipferlia bialata]